MQAPKFYPPCEILFSSFVESLRAQRDSAALPLLIGIGGPGGSGKSVLTRYLQSQLENCAVLELDDFRLAREQRPSHAPFGSHPDAVDMIRLQAVLRSVREGGALCQPHFDREAGRVRHETVQPSADWILVDGEITAYDHLSPYLDHLVLLQCSLFTQFRSRLARDRTDRNCSLIKTLRIFTRSNLLDHPRFASNAKARASCILYRQRNNRLRLLKAQL